MIKTVFTASDTLVPGDTVVLYTNVTNRIPNISEQYFCDNCETRITDETEIHLSDVTLEWYPLNSMRHGVRLLICPTCRPTVTVNDMFRMNDIIAQRVQEAHEEHISGHLADVVSDAISKIED